MAEVARNVRELLFSGFKNRKFIILCPIVNMMLKITQSFELKPIELAEPFFQ